MGKLLSIIIPTYNMEKYLDRCISSLVVDAEHLQQLEVLVVNDGSKDRSSEIAHRYQEKFPETVIVIDKPNGHYGSCINRGLKEASGLFVKVLDADDSFDNAVFPRFLDFLARAEVREKADLILSDYTDVNDDQIPYRTLRYAHYAGAFTLDDIHYNDKLEWFIHGITYRTKLLKDNHYEQLEGVVYTDLEWAYTPMAYVQTLYKFDEPLYLYTHGREGQSVDDIVHAKNLNVEIQVTERLINTYEQLSGLVGPSQEAFLKERLYLLTTHIYQLYLIAFKQYKPQLTQLSAFDTYLLAHNPELHSKVCDYTTRIAGLSFQPIKDWRKGNTLRLSLQQALYNLANWANNHFRK